MRRNVAVTCAFAALLVVVGAGAGAAPGDPTPAASPPLGDDYFTAAEMERGLPEVTELPAGYTAGGDGSGFVYANPCSFMGQDAPWNTTVVSRTYTSRGGNRLVVDIAAVGTAAARETVATIAAVPRTCPVVTDSGSTKRNSPLPLPDLGDGAAGVISVAGDSSRERTFTAVVALGPVYVGFLATGSDQDRFVEAVQAGARTALRIGEPPAAAELERALLTAADLPDGFRETGDGDVRDYFTEDDCAGGPVDHGIPARFVHRALTKDGWTIRVAAGTAERARPLIGAMTARLNDCRTATRLRLPATDLTTNAGVVYPGHPVRARTIFVFRDVFTEILVTTTDGSGVAGIERILDGGWLAKVFDVYYPKRPEGT